MKWLKRGAIGAAMLIVGLALLPFFLPLDDYIPHIEREVSSKLKEPVSIASLRASLIPYPHVTVNGIAVGKTGDVKVGRVTVTPELWSLLSEVKTIRSIEIDGLALTQQALQKLPLWTKSDGTKAPARVRIDTIRLDGAVVQLGKSALGPFDARISLNPTGEPLYAEIRARDGTLKATLKPEGQKYLLDADAKAWKMPMGPPLTFDTLQVKGVITLKGATLDKIHAQLYGGTASGSTSIGWEKGMQVTGRLDVQHIELRNLVPLLSPGSRMSGRLSAKPVLSARANTASQLLEGLRIETPFNVQNGVLYGVDIHKAATSLLTREPTGGETRFDELSGHLVMERGAYRFTRVKIASGALAAGGQVTISPSKELSGRISAEVKAGTVASADVPLNVSGTVQSPLLLPTGGTVAGAAVGTAILGPGLGTSVGAKVGQWTEGLFGKKEERKR